MFKYIHNILKFITNLILIFSVKINLNFLDNKYSIILFQMNHIYYFQIRIHNTIIKNYLNVFHNY